MANVVVVGAQWGDEGKGKIVDWLSLRADVVARFQGGHNAGHTLVVDGVVYKLSLMPSGVVRGKLSLLGNGVVIDPWAFLAEVEKVRAQGVAIPPDLVKIAETAAPGSVILAMLPDTGERYMSTPLFEAIPEDMDEEDQAEVAFRAEQAEAGVAVVRAQRRDLLALPGGCVAGAAAVLPPVHMM